MREAVRQSIAECSQMERFNLITRLGNDILVNGGEIFRANEAMQYAAAVFRLEGFNAFVIANGIFSTAVIDGRIYSTRICYVPLAPTVLCRVDELNHLARRIAAGRCGPFEMRSELERIEKMDVSGSRMKVLASGLGSGSFCYLFGGSFFDMGAAFLAGLVLYLFLIYVAPWISVSRIMRNILASAVVGLTCCLLLAAGIGDSLDRVMIGAVFPLAPGIPLTNSVRNFLENDYLSGLIRLVDAFLTAGCIAIGVGTALQLWAVATGTAMGGVV